MNVHFSLIETVGVDNTFTNDYQLIDDNTIIQYLQKTRDISLFIMGRKLQAGKLDILALM